MRRILVGAMVVLVAAAGPAMAGPAGGNCAGEPTGSSISPAVHYANPTGRVVDDSGHGAGAEFGLSVASTVLSLLYLPPRFVLGVVGAGLGGFSGWATGGDMRTAKGIWRPTTEGHYFIRPDYLDGTERFRFDGAVPPRGEPAVVEERVTMHESATPSDPPSDDATL